MAIPDYQTIMLPLLELVKDGEEHRIRDAYDRIADQFNLTPTERRHLLPSGKGATIKNRVQWAKVYLLKAGLLESPQRGVVKITERGRDLLRTQPARIDNAFLRQYPEFVEFRESSARNEKAESDDMKTLDESLEDAYLALRKTLASEVLVQAKSATPEFFEKLVVDLLVAMGYGGSLKDAGQVVGRSGDGGIDGIIKEDRLGLDVVYVQAKRWENVVGRPDIQKFVGALQGQRSRKGVYLTTSSFSEEAKKYAATIDTKVILIDGTSLADLMIDFDVGVSPVSTYVTKRIDTDYFSEE